MSGPISAQEFWPVILAKLPGTTLFIDIGTNGELVLAADGSLTASATAAGPAFEGMNISCGMRGGHWSH